MKKKIPWADIHAHSQASDGSLSPTELIHHAKECGLFGLSITDHDTTAAYAEAIPVAREVGIRLGVGIEFSSVFEGQDVHLLGYDFDLNSPDIEALCMRHKNRRLNRNLAVLEKLRSHKMDITMEDIKEHGDSVGRPHIAHVMVQRGYVRSIKEAFDKYLGEGRCCYVRGDALTVDETIAALHKAHGKAFLAHPHLLAASFPIHRLLEKSFDGLECRYAKLSAKSAEPWEKIARSQNWHESAGSDFHGSVKPGLPLGCQGVDQATFERIFENAPC